MVLQAINDGLTRMEVEFPALPSSVDGARAATLLVRLCPLRPLHRTTVSCSAAAYKSGSDDFIDANVQLAIAAGRLVRVPAEGALSVNKQRHAHLPDTRACGRAQLTQRLGKRVHIVVPDEGEYNRSYRMCARVQGTLTV